MALQSIKSGAFKFSKTIENLDKVSTPGSIIISVDDDTNLTGDIRVHDGATPGGISAPPPGTISYIITPRKMIVEKFTANTDPSFISSANTISFSTNYPGNGDFINGPYKLFRITVNTKNPDFGNGLSSTRNKGYRNFDLPNLNRFAATGYQYPFVSEVSANTVTSRPNCIYNRVENFAGKDELYYNFDAEANTLSISVNNYMYPISTGDEVLLSYVDGQTGFQDPDGWFYCDGRRLSKQYYSALFNEIGDIWNNRPTDAEQLEIANDTSKSLVEIMDEVSEIYTFQDFRGYYALGYNKRFEVDYSNGDVRVYKNTKNSDGTFTDVVEIASTDYSKGVDGSGQSYIQFPDASIPKAGEKIVIIGTPESDEFQIPDFRGFYLRAWNSNQSLVNGVLRYNTPMGINSKKMYSIQKHSHFMSMAQSGGHSHEYQPWEFGNVEPFARTVWAGMPLDTNNWGDDSTNAPTDGLDNEEFYGKWIWWATDGPGGDIETNNPRARLTRVRQTGHVHWSYVETNMFNRTYNDDFDGHFETALSASANLSKDHTTYILGSGPTNMADFGPSRTENTVYNWKHKHYIEFHNTFIDPGELRGRSTNALGYEYIPGNTLYGNETSDTNPKVPGAYRVSGRPTTSSSEIDITNIKLPTFIKY